MVLLVSILVGLVNPYGIQIMISIFGFYFSGALNSVVSELQAYSPFLNEGTFIAYLVIMGVAFLCLVGNRKYFRMRYFLLFFGFMALALNTVKAFSQLILVMGFPIALMYQKVRIERIIDAKMAREAICFDVGILVVNAFIATLIAVLIFLPQTPSTVLVKAVDVIDADVGEVDKSSLKIYTGYNDGGYVEFRGYKAYLDPRGNPEITKEWSDFNNGRIESQELLKKYRFDYLLVRDKNDPFYNLENDECKEIFEEEKEAKVYKCYGNSI